MLCPVFAGRPAQKNGMMSWTVENEDKISIYFCVDDGDVLFSVGSILLVYLVVEPTHLKKMRKSNWILKHTNLSVVKNVPKI